MAPKWIPICLHLGACVRPTAGMRFNVSVATHRNDAHLFGHARYYYTLTGHGRNGVCEAPTQPLVRACRFCCLAHTFPFSESCSAYVALLASIHGCEGVSRSPLRASSRMYGKVLTAKQPPNRIGIAIPSTCIGNASSSLTWILIAFEFQLRALWHWWTVVAILTQSQHDPLRRGRSTTNAVCAS